MTGLGSFASSWIRLNSEPTGDVTLTPRADNEFLLRVTTAREDNTLVFTPDNWRDRQSVTMTEVDERPDGAADPGKDVPVIVQYAVSGGGYDEVEAPRRVVRVRRAVARSANFDIRPPRSSLPEDGGTMTYELEPADADNTCAQLREVIGPEGTGIVYIVPIASDPEAVTLSTNRSDNAIRITSGNCRDVHRVTVTAIDDDIVNTPDRELEIGHVVTVDPATVDGSDLGGLATRFPLTLADDDTAGTTVSPVSLQVGEDGGTAGYTVVLHSEPTGDVTVTPKSSDATAARVSGPLTFTAENWETPQSVTVTGVNDDRVNAEARLAEIAHTMAGGGYGDVGIGDVEVSVIDDDMAGLTIAPTSLEVDEDGGTVTYTVVLHSEPTGDVTVRPASSDETAARVSGPLTFTAENWNREQTVTVTGRDDDIVNDPARTAEVSHRISGGGYSDLTIDSVTVTLKDDESAGVAVSVRSLTVEEAGAAQAYTLVLTSEPSATVTVTPASGDRAAATVSGPLTFTSGNWDTPQTVTVTGVNDHVANPNGRREVTVTHAAASADTDYNGVEVAELTVIVSDAGAAPVFPTPATAQTATEDEAFSYQVPAATDPEGGALTYTATAVGNGNAVNLPGSLTATATP